jgi:hypothetical protein
MAFQSITPGRGEINGADDLKKMALVNMYSQNNLFSLGT